MKQYPLIKLDHGGLRSMLVWAGCGVFLVSLLAVHAGDPIKFSPSGDAVVLPDKNAKENKFDGPIKGGSEESPGMYELPTATPSSPSSSVLFNNKKLQELIDQRKNWIYMTPEMSMESGNTGFEKDKSTREAASELFDKGGKSKKVVERYMENQDRQNTLRNRANADRVDAELNLEKGGMGMGGGNVSNERESTVVNPGFNSTVPQSALSSPLRDLRRIGFSAKSSSFQDYGSQMRMESDQRFQQLLHPSANKASVNGAPNDPMRLLADGTSQELQPVTGKSLETLAGEKTKSATDPFGDPNQAAFPRSFGSINSTIFGPSSLSPAIIAPAPGSALMSQPIVLPLPKRKF